MRSLTSLVINKPEYVANNLGWNQQDLRPFRRRRHRLHNHQQHQESGQGARRNHEPRGAHRNVGESVKQLQGYLKGRLLQHHDSKDLRGQLMIKTSNISIEILLILKYL